ncbi:MAG: DUF488 domain-containing protein [Thermodesulfobacteriota bacterium]
MNAWLRELAPSDELRRWFKHDPARWDEFRRRYRQELRGAHQQQLIDELAEQASRRNVTLIYSSREERFNSASSRGPDPNLRLSAGLGNRRERQRDSSTYPPRPYRLGPGSRER